MNNLFFTQNSEPIVYSMQPDSWESVEQAIEMLKAGQIILFNLEGVSPSFAQRLTDFTSGCLCALAGHQVTISRDVFLFCPPNVKVSIANFENQSSDAMGSNSAAMSA